MFATGELPQCISWSFLAVIPKPDGGTRGLGLLDILWKLVEAIIDTRVKRSVKLHDILHGFVPHRGTGTAIIEAKLQQELASILDKVLYQLFLDLKKAYDKVDRKRALDTLQGYGVGPRICRLIKHFWDSQKIVPRQAGYYGPVFTATGGTTQCGLFSPALFNIQIDSVIRHWLTLVIDDNGTIQDGLGETVASKLSLFYADDGLVASLDNDWLQHALDVLVDLFLRINLATNTVKTVTMTCFPNYNNPNLSEAAYKRRMTGTGPTFRARQRAKVTCPQCDKSMNQSSLQTHLRTIHGLDPSTTALPKQVPTAAYRISFSKALASRDCPVPGCLGRSTTWAGLRHHFNRRHPDDILCIVEEGGQPLPRCSKCDMHVSELSLNRGHQSTQQCRAGALRRQRRLRALANQRAKAVTFTAMGQPLHYGPHHLRC